MKPDCDFHTYARNAPKIAVFGSDGDHCTDEARKIAYDVGVHLAERGAIVYTGGGTGVMEAASKGVADLGGLCIGIRPDGDPKTANPHCSLLILTGIGYARAQILVGSIDGAILVEGGIGTMIEAAEAYYLRKPIVSIASSGGTASEFAGKMLDKRKHEAILSAPDAESAVRLVLEEVQRRKNHAS